MTITRDHPVGQLTTSPWFFLPVPPFSELRIQGHFIGPLMAEVEYHIPAIKRCTRDFHHKIQNELYKQTLQSSQNENQELKSKMKETCSVVKWRKALEKYQKVQILGPFQNLLRKWPKKIKKAAYFLTLSQCAKENGQ